MKGLKRNPSATNSYRMAKILLKLGCGRNFIYLPGNKEDKTCSNCNHETEYFLRVVWGYGYLIMYFSLNYPQSRDLWVFYMCCFFFLCFFLFLCRYTAQKARNFVGD